MAENKLNTNSVSADDINGIPEKSFNKLNDELKTIVLNGNNNSRIQDKEAGIFGKFLGSNTKNASIHVALILCIILLTICIFDMSHSFFTGKSITSDIWNLVFPIITLSLGYIFGKGDDK